MSSNSSSNDVNITEEGRNNDSDESNRGGNGNGSGSGSGGSISAVGFRRRGNGNGGSSSPSISISINSYTAGSSTSGNSSGRTRRRHEQDHSPFVSMIQQGNMPILTIERISNFADSRDILHLSRTCQILQQKIQTDWGGWNCDNCQRQMFTVLPTRSMEIEGGDPAVNNNPMPIKVGGCCRCRRRLCPECTEQCVDCGRTACEEGHCSFQQGLCINVVCIDDYQQSEQPSDPRQLCRGCLNKCRSCEDCYCSRDSTIQFCRWCGESECGYCRDYCFDEYYGY